MDTALHLWLPEQDGEPGRGKVRSLPPPTPQPVPLMRGDLEQETPYGPRVDQIILWRNEDAARCRWCAERDCTFMAGPEGQGFCVVRRPAHQADSPPPRFRGVGGEG